MQPTVDYKTDFLKALSLQQEGKSDEAINLYKQILDQNAKLIPDLSPEQISQISYNAALAYFTKQDYAKSYVYNQKAILLDSSNKEARDFADKINSQFQIKTIAHDISFIENLNKSGFSKAPIDIFWILSTLCLAMFVRSLSFYFLRRKKELIENIRLSRFTNRNYFWLVGFVVFAGFTYLKYSDMILPKGLIKTDQLILKAAAGENQASLTDLPIGSLVHILRSETIDNKTYYQIKYPGGVSGWVNKEEIETIILPKD